MNPVTLPETPHTFLVFVNDPVASEDIVTTLLELHPHGNVLRPTDARHALTEASAAAALAVAVVSMSPEDAEASPLGRALRDAGAKLVLMGLAAEERGEAAGFAVLHRPFRTADLLRILAFAKE